MNLLILASLSVIFLTFLVGAFFLYLERIRKKKGLLPPNTADIESIRREMDEVHEDNIRMAAIEGSLDAHTVQLVSMVDTSATEGQKESFFEVSSSFIAEVHHNEQVIRENWNGRYM